MSTDENKAIARRFFAAFAADDQSALLEVLAPDVVGHLPGAPGPANREMMLEGIHAFNSAVSEHHITIHDLIAEGDLVATRTSAWAVHTAEFQGLPPTGRRIELHDSLTIERIRDGKIVERWVRYDAMDLMRQLGALPHQPANSP